MLKAVMVFVCLEAWWEAYTTSGGWTVLACFLTPPSTTTINFLSAFLCVGSTANINLQSELQKFAKNKKNLNLQKQNGRACLESMAE